MRQITKWLNSLNPEDFSESNSTSSVYYIIEGIKIRLADHFTPHPKNCDLQIICPINDPSIYIVTIKEGLQVLGYRTLNKLQDFIMDYSLIFRIRKTSEEMKITQIDSKQRLIEEDPVKDHIVNGNLRTSSQFWGQLSEYLIKDCPKYKNFSAGQKKACKALLATNKAYKDCVHLINVISNAKNFSTSTMVRFFEPYINAKLI